MQTLKIDQILPIVQALHGKDLEMIFTNEDEEPVIGPDGVQGWFNSFVTANAVKDFDAETVRTVVDLRCFCAQVHDADRDLNEDVLVRVTQLLFDNANS